MSSSLFPYFTRPTNPNIAELVFIEENKTKANWLDLDRLDVLVFKDVQTIHDLESLQIFVTRNIHVKPKIINEFNDSAFLGFGVNEILTPNGYEFANGIKNYFEPCNPVYELKRDRILEECIQKSATNDERDESNGVFSSTENGVGIIALFTAAANKTISCTLIHSFPFAAEPKVRHFSLLGNERGGGLDGIKLAY